MAATYTLNKEVDTIVNTKNTDQAEWPRRYPAFSKWEVTKVIDYNEWTGAIWGPATPNMIEYTYDDLVEKY